MVKLDQPQKIQKEGLRHLLSTPTLSVSLFFMSLTGILMYFLFIRTNEKFSKHTSFLNSPWLVLAMGVLPGGIIMTIYHLICEHRMISSFEDLGTVALPSSLILGGLAFILVIYRALK